MSWDKFSDTTSRAIGNKSFFVGFTFATVIFTFLGIIGLDKDFGAFTLGLSILAIYVVIFLQNSQNREQDKQAKNIKEDLKHTKRILFLLEHIDKRL